MLAGRSSGKASIVLFGVMLLALSFAGMADASNPRIKCSYVQAGAPGPSGNRLDIRVTKFEEVVALLPAPNGAIRVYDDQRGKRQRCVGGRPSMTNIDLVRFRTNKRSSSSTLFVGEAPFFGPGATSYAEGGKGISFDLRGDAVSLGLGGTEGDDRISIGSSGDGTAIDLGPAPEPFPDGSAASEIDLRVHARFLSLVVKAGEGNDQVVAGGPMLDSTDLEGPLKGATSIYGEGGNDVIVGGSSTDYLDGGTGADVLRGGPGADQLFGGPGLDDFFGEGGNDDLDAIDRKGETIDCGPGRDLAQLDLVDTDQGCEKFRFP